MILSKGTLKVLTEKNDELNASMEQELFFDEVYLNDRLHLKVELGKFIGHRMGYMQSKKVQIESSIEAGVGLLRRALTLVKRTRESVGQGYVHEEKNWNTGHESYGSYEEILKEYRELSPYYDTYLLAKMADMNTHRNLSGIIAGTLIILERLGVDEIELADTFIETAPKQEMKV